MADNYLERHREDYEERKQAWLRHKKHMPKVKKSLHQPEDEAL
ncbi:MAG: dehydrogenase [Prevotella sp.]|nr:dehydrogenase [Prevotella sp.]MDD7335796.1 dehydrogenase [Prevotella sp.]MDY4625499.1 dehydrogenase [Prevotella sp.]MDY4666838.1 dehydrogenase [Prevotella sp.]MDY5257968.1 dehydrogenase [Prevotella sp.]